MNDGSHLVFVWTPNGYVLQERHGELPEVGSQVEVSIGQSGTERDLNPH